MEMGIPESVKESASIGIWEVGLEGDLGLGGHCPGQIVSQEHRGTAETRPGVTEIR
jgi:hypothetical protein